MIVLQSKDKGKATPVEAYYRPIGFQDRHIIIIIIIIIIFINCNWVVTRWQWLIYMYTNMKKKVTRKFKSGGLHERHVV